MDATLISFLESEGYTHIKYINGRGYCGLKRFVFTTGLVVGLDYSGYVGRYCYHSSGDAKTAINNWTGIGDPDDHWIKYKGDGEDRSNPNNDKYK
jgi:hypothetical protein